MISVFGAVNVPNHVEIYSRQCGGTCYDSWGVVYDRPGYQLAT